MRTLSGRDKVVIAVLLGVPLFVDLLFIWLPALATIALSFTKWNGIGGVKLSACKKSLIPGLPQRSGCLFGLQNYHQAFNSGITPDFTWDNGVTGSIPTSCGMVCWGAPGGTVPP